ASVLAAPKLTLPAADAVSSGDQAVEAALQRAWPRRSIRELDTSGIVYKRGRWTAAEDARLRANLVAFVLALDTSSPHDRSANDDAESDDRIATLARGGRRTVPGLWAASTVGIRRPIFAVYRRT